MARPASTRTRSRTPSPQQTWREELAVYRASRCRRPGHSDLLACRFLPASRSQSARLAARRARSIADHDYGGRLACVADVSMAASPAGCIVSLVFTENPTAFVTPLTPRQGGTRSDAYPQSCKITHEVDGAPKQLAWTPAQGQQAELAALEIYDTECGQPGKPDRVFSLLGRPRGNYSEQSCEDLRRRSIATKKSAPAPAKAA